MEYRVSQSMASLLTKEKDALNLILECYLWACYCLHFMSGIPQIFFMHSFAVSQYGLAWFLPIFTNLIRTSFLVQPSKYVCINFRIIKICISLVVFLDVFICEYQSFINLLEYYAY